MNIEELAKDQEKGKKPAKKKGYDDVEISDLSDGDDEKKDKTGSKRKDVKPGGKTTKTVKPKTLKKDVKEEKKGPPGRAPAAGAPAPDENMVPQRNDEPPPQNVAPLPRHANPSMATTSEKDKQKQGCCVLM
ncbi:hypothetical protein Q1695_014287 [Nippostrongylus brasiliensis]|nr:hypothetical protein Q1695_014287 [Nippostrongylus brasiliensis]